MNIRKKAARWSGRKLLSLIALLAKKGLVLAKVGMRYNERAFGRVHWSVSSALYGIAFIGAFVGAIYLQMQDAERKRLAFIDKEMQCLQLNIYHEARGEPELGQKMVAHVTLSRAKANRSHWGGDTVCGVVYARKRMYSPEKGKYIWVYQFEWAGKSKEELAIRNEKAWEAAKAVAEEVYRGKFIPPSELAPATYYMNEKVVMKSSCRTADWFYSKLVHLDLSPQLRKQLGNHQFFRDPVTEREKVIAETETDLCPPKTKPLSSR